MSNASLEIRIDAGQISDSKNCGARNPLLNLKGVKRPKTGQAFGQGGVDYMAHFDCGNVAEILSNFSADDIQEVATKLFEKKRRQQILNAAKAMLDTARFRANEINFMPAFNPGWETLIELYVNHRNGRRLASSDIGLDTRTPPTTLIRWISMLVEAGLATRESDLRDKRRTWITLSASGINHVENVLANTYDAFKRDCEY